MARMPEHLAESEPEASDANTAGSYKSLEVNDGKNFRKQHNPGVSKVCKINLDKKKKAAHQKSQPRLLTFFTKQAKDLVPPTVPTPTRVIAYDMESTSSRPCVMPVILRMASLLSETQVVSVLATLEKAVRKLPGLPEAREMDEIAEFAQSVPMNLDKDDAWEYFDPILNYLLGFNRTTECISKELRGGERGLVAMVRYLREFVGQYQIDEGLLEGKIKQLLDVIQMRTDLSTELGTELTQSDAIQDTIVILDSEEFPSKQQEHIFSVTRHQSLNIPAKLCPGYRLVFSPSQQAHTSYPFGLHSLLVLPWDYRFKHGAGIHSMLKIVKKAAEGTYHPKGSNEENDLQALLFLRLGGARVADIAH
ncbi:hypothetical protein BJV77DRAFT_1072684 [Russula vinacea]|nr:hypothetical protein BJV77DRAFT_1072684 [Russula vinacea]